MKPFSIKLELSTAIWLSPLAFCSPLTAVLCARTGNKPCFLWTLLGILKLPVSLGFQSLITFASAVPDCLWSFSLVLLVYLFLLNYCWLYANCSCLLNKLQVCSKRHWTSEENFTSSRFSRWWRDRKLKKKTNLLFVGGKRALFLWAFIPVHATLQMKLTTWTAWGKAPWMLSQPWVEQEYKMHWF